MKTLLVFVLGTIALACGAGFLFFPTPELTQQLLDGLIGGTSQRVTFGDARLRPWGLCLDDVRLLGADGGTMATLDWVTVRPSLSGILHLTGRPAHASLGLCAGRLDVDGDLADGAVMLQAAWADLQLERCGLPPPFDAIRGRTSGDADVARQANGTWSKGEGHLQLAAGFFPVPEGRIPGIETLVVDRLDTEWALAAEKLTLASVKLEMPELTARGQGTLTLRGDLGSSPMRLRGTVTPQSHAPPLLQRFLATLPVAPGEPSSRVAIVEGTLGDPHVVRHE